MKLIPFSPFPYFQWVLLAIFCLFALLQPNLAILSAIWFGFASNSLCNRISFYLTDRPFRLQSNRFAEKPSALGTILVIPFIAGTLVPTWLLFKVASWVRVVV